MSADPRVCMFHVGDLTLGLPVADVQELLRSQRATRVPLAPAAIRGLINLRGQIVPAVDLRERLGIPDDGSPRPNDGTGGMNVVVRTPEGVVSLVVDGIDDIIDVREIASEEPPPNLRGIARQFVRCVYKLPGRLLLLLDTRAAAALV